jgi:hypothetical protein
MAAASRYQINMATTQNVRRDSPAPARRRRRPALQRAAGARAVYDQDADMAVRDARRPASPDLVRTPGTAYDAVARWLALTSLALVTLIFALIILL